MLFRSARQQQTINPDTKTRPSVTWAKDSTAFHITRRDSRGVKELWVINSLAEPRPTIEKYPYPMPGEEKIRKSELYFFERDKEGLHRVEPKWTDESYTNVHWNKDAGEELRFIRRDRLLRNIELCAVDLETGDTTCLLSEGFENANIAPQPVDRKSTRLNSSHSQQSRMPSSA